LHNMTKLHIRDQLISIKPCSFCYIHHMLVIYAFHQ
jgi:hypothetical protein